MVEMVRQIFSLDCIDLTILFLGPYCCLNGANNPDCCLNGGSGPYCCGDLKKLIGNDPSKDGFSAGTYIDGSTIYAGTGNFSQCFGQNPGPARVSSLGAYMTCGLSATGEYSDSASAQYYVQTPDLMWVPTTASAASSVKGAIVVAPGFYVGRKFMPSLNGTYQQVGKIQSGSFYYKTPGRNDERTFGGEIDVLACVRCTNGGTGKSFTTFKLLYL